MSKTVVIANEKEKYRFPSLRVFFVYPSFVTEQKRGVKIPTCKNLWLAFRKTHCTLIVAIYLHLIVFILGNGLNSALTPQAPESVSTALSLLIAVL